MHLNFSNAALKRSLKKIEGGYESGKGIQQIHSNSTNPSQKKFPKFLIVFKRVTCETNSKDSGNKIFHLVSSKLRIQIIFRMVMPLKELLKCSSENANNSLLNLKALPSPLKVSRSVQSYNGINSEPSSKEFVPVYNVIQHHSHICIKPLLSWIKSISNWQICAILSS